jgi:hypothetical protein
MSLKESIDLDIDQSNELQFKIQVEGNDVSPAKVRLVCESDDLSFVFNGHGTDLPGVVQFDIPRLSGRIKEGTYQSSVEVLIDNRYFAPVQFELRFKQPIKVTAEAVLKPQTVIKKNELRVSAVPLIVEQKKPEPAPVVVQKQADKREDKRSNIEERILSKRRQKLSETRDLFTKSGMSKDELTSIVDDFARTALSTRK